MWFQKCLFQLAYSCVCAALCKRLKTPGMRDNLSCCIENNWDSIFALPVRLFYFIFCALMRNIHFKDKSVSLWDRFPHKTSSLSLNIKKPATCFKNVPRLKMVCSKMDLSERNMIDVIWSAFVVRWFSDEWNFSHSFWSKNCILNIAWQLRELLLLRKIMWYNWKHRSSH